MTTVNATRALVKLKKRKVSAIAIMSANFDKLDKSTDLDQTIDLDKSTDLDQGIDLDHAGRQGVAIVLILAFIFAAGVVTMGQQDKDQSGNLAPPSNSDTAGLMRVPILK